ncbi:MAG: glutamate 5-kinase [Actinomycetota bacterium]|nr:glutamate 5-kinase [Actinomycetota bacterium]
MSFGDRHIEAGRIAIKVGTYTLNDPSGRLDRGHMRELVRQLSSLRSAGREVILVSSGAIAAGVETLGLAERPEDIPSLQAVSSVGQGLLVHLYTTFFGENGILVGQVLLTQYDFAHRQQYLNARATFNRLLERGVVPLVNENDTVAVEEIRFGDNDRLAALVAVLTDADLLVMLSDIQGFYTADPKRDSNARLMYEVGRITPDMMKAAGEALEEHSSGGMTAKLEAARISTSSGIGVVVAPGREPRILERVLQGERVGTYFHPGKKELRDQKHWIAYGTRPRGTIVIDEGAREAILNRGKSLLPAGVIECGGDFGPGDAVDVADSEGRILARGLCGLSSGEVREVKGMRTDDAARRLGEDSCDEVIHRDYMVVLRGVEEG